MARVVVDVMLKPEILDPQGKAVHGAFGRLGFDGVADVRQGKRFEITLEGEATEERIAEIRKAAETLLANPVIEDFTVHAEPTAPQPAAEAEDTTQADGEAEGEGEAEAEVEAEAEAEVEAEAEAEVEPGNEAEQSDDEAEAVSEGEGEPAEAGSEQR